MEPQFNFIFLTSVINFSGFLFLRFILSFVTFFGCFQNAMDHDVTTKCSIIPSVFLLADIPPCASDSWVQGNVKVTLHDGVFQQSSALRFAAEIVKIYAGTDTRVLMKYSDGSTEHRTLLVSHLIIFRYFT